MTDADIARTGCICCWLDGHGWVEPSLHHVRNLGGKRKNCVVLPLCHRHHQGVDGIHTSKDAFRGKYGREEVLYELVRQRVEGIKKNTIGGRDERV